MSGQELIRMALKVADRRIAKAQRELNEASRLAKELRHTLIHARRTK